MRVVFPYFAQLHQVFHSLPIAAEIASRHPEVEVHVATAQASHLSFIPRLLAEHAPEAPVRIDSLSKPLLGLGLAKKRTMQKNLDYFRQFDGVITPERTSLYLRRRLSPRTKLIWTRHGAGDRAIGFASDVAQFDYVLIAGRKIESRLRAEGLIRDGHYTTGVYAKFDWAGQKRLARPWFDNGRPTILYNPHFEPDLSSWQRLGFRVLEFFANSTAYNLIFAPHIRLFDRVSKRQRALFQPFESLPHIRIDLGSLNSIDMSYVQAADVYLGDVSSQVSEFLCRPRPCVFFNAHGVQWRNDPNYRFWHLGKVVEYSDQLDSALQEAISTHKSYRQAQVDYFEETFGLCPGEKSAARGAEAILDYLRQSRPA